MSSKRNTCRPRESGAQIYNPQKSRAQSFNPRIFILECRKIKRTGFIPAFLGGGLLAGAVPILNMAVRSEMYLNANGSPISILLGANWQMMAMLNLLLLVTGACILYHTEYADNAMQKMNALPIREHGLFFGKLFLLTFMLVVTLLLEMAAISFCAFRWFSFSVENLAELVKDFGFLLLLTMPAALLALIVSVIFENMWISLGIGVICIFIATMLPANNFVLSLFPFAMPFQTLVSARFVIAAILETFGFCTVRILFFRPQFPLANYGK